MFTAVYGASHGFMLAIHQRQGKYSSVFTVPLWASLRPDRSTKTANPGGPHNRQGRTGLFLTKTSCEIKKLKSPLLAYAPIFPMTLKRGAFWAAFHLWSHGICWHCFVNVASLLQRPQGLKLICGSIILLPVADISTGYCRLIPQTASRMSNACLGLHPAESTRLRSPKIWGKIKNRARLR